MGSWTSADFFLDGMAVGAAFTFLCFFAAMRWVVCWPGGAR